MIINSINKTLELSSFKEETKTIRVPGMAMSPEITSGDVVALKKIHNLDFLIFGESYLVVTNSFYNSLRLVRKVYEHKEQNKITLRAINPDFSGDLVIPKDSIVAMYKVNTILRERSI